MILNHTARNEAFQEVVDALKEDLCSSCRKEDPKVSCQNKGTQWSCNWLQVSIQGVRAMIFEVPKG